MAQKPTAGAYAVATLTLYQDAVAREVFGTSRSDLTSNQQTDLDLEGNSAFMEVTEVAKWYAKVQPGFVDPTTEDLPREFNELFRAVWVEKCLRRFRSPQAAAIHRSSYVDPLQRRLFETFVGDDFDATSILADDSLTPRAVRNGVIAELARQRSPVLPPIETLDRIIREQFVRLWNFRPWEFTKRSIQVTINISGEVEIDPSLSLVFDGMVSKTIVLEGGINRVYWLDATRHAEMSSKLFNETGRPLYFYDIDYGNETRIQVLPIPDQAYTGFMVMKSGAPAFTALDSNDGIVNLPIEFRGMLREMVFTEALSRWGRENSDIQRHKKAVNDALVDIAHQWDDKGASRHTARGHHGLKFVSRLASYQGDNLIGPY